MRSGDRLNKCVRERVALAVAAVDVEARIEQAAVLQLAEHRSAPRQTSFAGRIDPTVAGVHAGAVAVRKRQALAVDTDTLGDEGVAGDGRTIAAKEAVVEPAPERRATEDSPHRDHAPAHRPELRRLAAVQQLFRTAAAVTGGRHEEQEDERAGLQPVQPQRPTPPYEESLRYVR
jgi:hypothetical protein